MPFAAKLNAFQHNVLVWEDRLVYNAAQAMRLTITPTIQQLNVTWQSTLNDLRIGRITRDGDFVRYYADEDAIANSTVLDCTVEDINDFFTHNLNEKYGEDGMPFRPFVRYEAGGAMIGTIYRHWVCDSFCIRTILREWLLRLMDSPAIQRSPMLPAREGYWHHFGSGAADWPMVSTLMQQVSQSTRMKACRRLVRIDRDHTARFREFRAEAGLISAIRKSARRRGVKVNDLFLAALARTADQHSPVDRKSARPNLAMGTVVDLRGLRGNSPGDQFGVFLGFTNNIVRPQAIADTDRLIRDIAGQSAMSRDRGLAQASQVRMAFAYMAEHFLSGDKLEEFYRKRFALAAGISNVTLHNTWAAELHPHIMREYIRVSPTGPLTPLVVTPTTLGDNLHVGVTTRRALIDDITAARAGETFLAELTKLT